MINATSIRYNGKYLSLVPSLPKTHWAAGSHFYLFFPFFLAVFPASPLMKSILQLILSDKLHQKLQTRAEKNDWSNFLHGHANLHPLHEREKNVVEIHSCIRFGIQWLSCISFHNGIGKIILRTCLSALGLFN